MVSPLSSIPIIEQRPLTLPAIMGTGKRQRAILSLSLEAPTTCCTSRNLRKEWRSPRHYLPSLIVQSLILESHPYWDLSCVPPRCHQASKGGNHLSCCPMALQQGRLTWRHDRALKVIYDFTVSLQSNSRVFCDLKGLRALTTLPALFLLILFQPLHTLTLPSTHQTALHWLKSLFLGTVRTTSHRPNTEKVKGRTTNLHSLTWPTLVSVPNLSLLR